ncbi:MAG: hypothetical protein NVS1B7_6590 [Candidatus Saccharimonadales bacterium]
MSNLDDLYNTMPQLLHYEQDPSTAVMENQADIRQMLTVFRAEILIDIRSSIVTLGTEKL